MSSLESCDNQATRPARSEKPFVALILQGGGGLGAYHIGAYQALHEAGYAPDWVAGISIGAINAAIIAGNPAEQRLEKLIQLWEQISRPDWFTRAWRDLTPEWFNRYSYWEALSLGQPHFFNPRPVNPWLAEYGSVQATSFYDTAPLRATLCRLANFDLVSQGPMRITLGATDIETGNLVFFDNKNGTPRIEPEHVIASGSLPPGFAATPIGAKYFWDGGCVSNTPLEAVLDDQPEGHSLVFVIDLWGPSGKPPSCMEDVLWRQKQIQYASRTAHAIEAAAAKVNLRHALHALNAASPGVIDSPLDEHTFLTSGDRMDIVHIIYHPDKNEISSSDAEFSRPSIAARYEAGLADMRHALASAPWFEHEKPPHLGCVIHRASRGKIETRLGRS
ncbi:MAG: patatin-like phospholipase family protein [Acetobacteraceae bacterium]|nr:patatin-like phospholipase family protein [Acetobacteraceae bacterium]